MLHAWLNFEQKIWW